MEETKRVEVDLTALEDAGIVDKVEEKEVTGENHHFRFTEQEAIDNHLYDCAGSRSLKKISRYIMGLTNAYFNGKIDIIVK